MKGDSYTETVEWARTMTTINIVKRRALEVTLIVYPRYNEKPL